MTESFAELFEQSQTLAKLKPGTIVSGIVVEIRNDVVVVNAGLKSEGIVPIEQFWNERGELEVKVGDEVKVALDAIEDGFGETRLSREKAKRSLVWDELETAQQANATVVGKISGKVKGGFTVDIKDVRAFLPGSLVDVRPVRDPVFLEGKGLEFKIIKLDRKRNNVVAGAPGEPLFLDVVAAVADGWSRRAPGTPLPAVVGGRYGLSSKEFTPAMARAVFAEVARPEPRRRFTVGIMDDVTGLSLDWDRSFSIEPDDEVRAVFWGLGSDGTVGATKNTIKIIGEETPLYAQGYFVYDSKKAGAVTVSHLRFGPRPIRAPYLITSATFLACHQFDSLGKYDVLEIDDESRERMSG